MRIGTDIVEVSRIERAIKNGQTDFLHRVFTQQENININREDPNYERASGFWAAKEAVVKALGCGYRDGITFKDIEIGHDELGCPHFIFSGRVKEMLVEKQIENASLSISHCQNYATAVVILY
ncbi:holo-ACP synthase [Enterobacter mori]|uniref:holo-ACP synthase n=1 Tax=Enterobacter mori TaxID=539813 RepID=UPI0030196373